MNKKLETLGQDQPSYLGEEADIIIIWQFKMKWDHEQNYILKQKCGFLTVNEATFLLCHIASVIYLLWLWVPLRGGRIGIFFHSWRTGPHSVGGSLQEDEENKDTEMKKPFSR